jgi:hypothetical protein
MGTAATDCASCSQNSPTGECDRLLAVELAEHVLRPARWSKARQLFRRRRDPFWIPIFTPWRERLRSGFHDRDVPDEMVVVPSCAGWAIGLLLQLESSLTVAPGPKGKGSSQRSHSCRFSCLLFCAAPRIRVRGTLTRPDREPHDAVCYFPISSFLRSWSRIPTSPETN